MKGTVKWFSDSKGYGFISYQGNDIGAFVHYNNICGDGFKTLAEGQTVEFDLIGETPQRLQCVNVCKHDDFSVGGNLA